MHRRTSPLIALACAIPLILGACGSNNGPGDGDTPAATAPTSTPDITEDDDVSTDEPTNSDDASGTPLPTTPSKVPDEVIQREPVQAAIADLAKRQNVEPNAVEVVSFADVVWRDGSIGCPQDGMMYTQALVPGHLLILAVDGNDAHYHAAEGKEFTYCADPQPPAPGEIPTMDM